MCSIYVHSCRNITLKTACYTIPVSFFLVPGAIHSFVDTIFGYMERRENEMRRKQKKRESDPKLDLLSRQKYI